VRRAEGLDSVGYKTASPRDRDEAVAARYDSNLAKPIEPDDLAHAVAHAAKGVQRKKEAI
jgi:hypothetical protein